MRMNRHCKSMRAMEHNLLSGSRRECLRCGASLRMSVSYGVRKAHSSSETSEG
jgi:hypothetical protein